MATAVDLHARAPGTPRAVQRPMYALMLRLASALAFSILQVLVKQLGARGVWLPETLMWRQLVPAIMLFVWLASTGQLRRLATTRLEIHARRAAIGTAGMFLTLGVVLFLPLAEATVLTFTAPIFAVILSVALLGEHVGKWRVGAVLLGLLGVAIMANPRSAHFPLDGLAIGIGAAFSTALVSIQVRDLSRTEEPLTIVFWFSAMSVPVLAALLLFAPAGLHQTPLHHDAITWAMIAGVGVVGLATQMLLTAALTYGRVASVIVMDYTQFGWALLWGWLIYAHLPPMSTWLGAPAIIGAGLIIIWREQVRATRLARGS